MSYLAHRHGPTLLAGAIVALCTSMLIALPMWLPTLSHSLSYERSALLQGEWWRLLTAQWVHLSISHALMNGAVGTLLITLFAPWIRPVTQLVVIQLSGMLLLILLAYCAPDISWYVGLSGSLHGLAAYTGLLLLIKHPIDDQLDSHLAGLTAKALALVVLLWLTIKLGYEAAWQHPIHTTAAMPVLTLAHLLGAISGAALAVVTCVTHCFFIKNREYD